MKLDYFTKINTYRKAYFLGFILGDGAIIELKRPNGDVRTSTLSLSIHERDKYILDAFAEDIGCNRKPYKLKDYGNRPGSGELWRFTISRKEFIQPLIDLGIAPRKSLTAENILPNIPKKYRGACALGIYDADGSFTFANTNNRFGNPIRQYVQIRCTDSVAQGFISEFEIGSYSISHTDAIPNFVIGNKQEIIKLMSKLYYRCPIFLKRKKDKFIMLLNQVQTIS